MKRIMRIMPKGSKAVKCTGMLWRMAGLLCALSTLLVSACAFAMETAQPDGASVIRNERVELSEEELLIVENTRVRPIRVGMVISDAPSCYKEDDGECAGVFIEILKTVSQKTGLYFDYIPLDLSEGAPVTQLKAGKYDLVAGIVKTQNFLEDSALTLSSDVLDDSLIVVGRRGDDFTRNPEKKSMALMTGFQVANEYTQAHFPKHAVKEYPNETACLEAVRSGEADATVYLRLCMSYLLQNPHFENLEILPAFSRRAGTCVAGLSSENAVIIGIIDKGLSEISEDERTDVMMNFTIMSPYQPSLSDILYKYRLPLIAIVLLTFVVIASLLALMLLRHANARKLETALKIAEQASAAKGNFMSRMSHEIRTPLNAIIGYNSIARNEMSEAGHRGELSPMESRVLDCLAKCDIASRHLLTIINDVLDMSAIESGKIKVENERFNFKSLISSLTTIFYPQAQAKNIGFDVKFETETEEWFVGDQMRVNQILTNLLSNAIKFTPAGGRVTLSVCQSKTEEDTAELIFRVADTGIGMSPEYLARIWAPFEQADSSISRRYGGTGLGLSITKNLVDIMDGTIEVQSEVGGGSVFCVRLPFGRTVQMKKSSAYDFSGINALIIDDDAGTCVYVKQLLERFGARGSAVTSGADALKAMARASQIDDPYTLCLVDWQMPEMNGIETARHIRHIAGKEMPIIVITAYDFAQIREDAVEAGIDTFISKPVFSSSLFDLMVNICEDQITVRDVETTDYDFSGARVLLAEDNAMNMEVAKKILMSAGLKVDGVWNGLDAAAAFEASEPGTYKAILMDVHMPVMDGYTATKQIRGMNRPDAAIVPIIAMTADAFAENVAEARAAGMNDHIAKPIETETLFITLKKNMPDEAWL